MIVDDFLYLFKILKLKKVKNDLFKIDSHLIMKDFKVNQAIIDAFKNREIVKAYNDSNMSFVFCSKTYSVFIDGRQYTELRTLLNFLIFKDLVEERVIKGYRADNLLEIQKNNDIPALMRLINHSFENTNMPTYMKFYFPEKREISAWNKKEYDLCTPLPNNCERMVRKFIDMQVPFYIVCRDVNTYNEAWIEYRFNQGEYLVKSGCYPDVILDETEMANFKQMQLMDSL